MDGIPVLDYAPGTLVGIFVLLIAFGRLVPWSIVRDKNERIAFLESALDKSLDASATKDQALLTEQAAHSETRRQLTEEQRTGEIVRRVFEDGTR